MRYFAPLFLVIAISFASRAALATTPMWAELQDLVTFAPKALPDARLILEASRRDSRFTGRAQFLYGLHLTDAPTTSPDGSSRYVLAAMMHEGFVYGDFYRKLIVTVGGQPRQVKSVETKDIPLSRMHFVAHVGLLERMVLVEDWRNGVRIAFPIGVGGLDPGLMKPVVHLLTPFFHEASINRSRALAQGPPPYRGEPMLFVNDDDGTATGIAFHISILSDEEANAHGLNYLHRGFESHGCMRMRLKNLHEFYRILMGGAEDRIPLASDFFIWNADSRGVRSPTLGMAREILPYPFRDDSFMEVAYFPNQVPHYRIGDVTRVVIMNRRHGQPDLTRLKRFNRKDLASLHEFQGLKAEMANER